MRRRNLTKNYRKQKKEAFSITQKGFTFTMESCGKIRSRRLTSDNQYECSGYLVNGYPIDESESRYYIECYERFSDSGILRIKFRAEIMNEFRTATSYDALIAWLAESVLDTINTYEPDSAFNSVCKIIPN